MIEIDKHSLPNKRVALGNKTKDWALVQNAALVGNEVSLG